MLINDQLDDTIDNMGFKDIFGNVDVSVKYGNG